VRPVRKRGACERSLVVMSSEVETSREIVLGIAPRFLDSLRYARNDGVLE